MLAFLPSLPLNSTPLVVLLLLALVLRLVALACSTSENMNKNQKEGTLQKEVCTESGWYNVDEEKYEQAWGSGLSVVI